MKLNALVISTILTAITLTASDPEVHVYKKVDDRELAVHIFRPKKQAAPSPAVVWYHGGGWREGKAGQFFEHGKILANLGVVSISVDYRGFEGTPEKRDISRCIADAKSAFRWVKTHAKEFNIDTGRIAVGGGSAGGHLAAAMATLPGFDEATDDLSIPVNPNLQLLFNPAVDPSKVTTRDFSPLRTVKKNIAPAIIFHGEADTTVSITQAYDYKRAMDRVGAECALMAYKDQPHGFFNYRSGKNPYYYKTVGDMLVFLDDHGWLTR